MKYLIFLFCCSVLLPCNKIGTPKGFTIIFEVQDSSIKELKISYMDNIGLKSHVNIITLGGKKEVRLILDSISGSLPLFLTVRKDLYQLWAVPKADLKVHIGKDKVSFSGEAKQFAEYFLKAKEYWIQIYRSYEKRNPILSGKPKGYKYFTVQDSITLDRMKFLENFFNEKNSESVKNFIWYEKQNFLYSDIFYKISGLTSLKDFKFYQQKLQIPTDSFLRFTDKFDFNNAELFSLSQYRRCFEWMPFKISQLDNSDYTKNINKIIDFTTSLANNHLCKKLIEISLLDKFIRDSRETNSFHNIGQIRKRVENLGNDQKGIEKYYAIIKENFSTLIEMEKNSKKLISLLNDPKYSEGIEIIDFSKGKKLDVLKSIIQKYPEKILYVDFWAPWCHPCMEEIPYSEKLQQKLEVKNVLFIYLGIDCNEDSWKSTIAKLNLKGIHYLLTKEESEEYHKIFDFRGIPRYLIINKEGIVVDKNAPRPSDEKKIIDIISKL